MSILIDAVGEIDDKYIIEFAHVGPKKRMNWKMVSIAACMCAVLMAVVAFCFVDRSVPERPEGNVIWGTGSGDMGSVNFEDVKPGEITFSEELEYAFAQSGNPADVFAIKVIEVSGVPKDVVYEKFIRPLGVYEEYLSCDVIYITQEQARTIQLPEDLYVVFELAPNTSGALS